MSAQDPKSRMPYIMLGLAWLGLAAAAALLIYLFHHV